MRVPVRRSCGWQWWSAAALDDSDVGERGTDLAALRGHGECLRVCESSSVSGVCGWGAGEPGSAFYVLR